MFRTLYFYTVFYMASLVVSIIVRIRTKPVTKVEQDLIQLRWARPMVSWTGLKITTDIAPLDKNQNYLFLGNHQSNIDIPIFVYTLKDFAPKFIAKKSLFELPIFGKALDRIGHISIDRSNPRAALKSLDVAAEKTKNNVSIMIFPEGSRNKNPEKLNPFKSGAFILAKKSNLPIVPVLIVGANLVSKKKYFIDFSKPIHVKVLEPITPSTYENMSKNELAVYLQNIMETEYQKILQQYNVKNI